MKLFNKKDILTIATADQAVVGTKGFFADSLSALNDCIKRNDVRTLTDIFETTIYCFEVEKNQHRALFLPGERVRKPEYRPIATVDELFDFLVPDFDKDNIYDSNGNKIKVDTNKKAEYLLGRKITLKIKEFSNRTKVTLIQDVDFSNDDADSSNIYLNNLSLEYLFNNFKIQINGEFVPFGIEE